MESHVRVPLGRSYGLRQNWRQIARLYERSAGEAKNQTMGGQTGEREIERLTLL